MSTPGDPGPADGLTPDGLTELCRLIDGLDLLDRLFRLPTHPGDEGDVPLGRYHIRRRIGAGRFGVVFLADDPALSRRVAIKVPQPAVLADPELRTRFVREAQAVARLDLPGIVPVYEAGVYQGLAYIAAGYVDGPTLADWIARRPGSPTPATAARLVACVARAVHHAHERGVLHCDLKPANILLEAGDVVPGVGCPRITDFGLARLLEDDPSLTRTFQVAGTPLYMSPEQARGDRRTLTRRADVYALGAILHEMLTGRPPFDGSSTADTLRRIVSEPAPSPRALRPDVPRDLAAICLKCLEKDPARRYPDGEALAADLGRFLAGSPTLARPVRWHDQAAMCVRRNPVVASLAALVVTSLVLLTVLQWIHRNDLAASNTKLLDALAREQEAAAEAGRQHEVAVGRYRLLRRQAYLAEIRDAAALADRGLLTDHSLGPWEPEYGEDLRGFEWHYLTRLARGTRTWDRHTGPVTLGPITDDSAWCATIDGRQVRVWAVGTGRVVAEWDHPAELADQVAVSADGRLAAAVPTTRNAVLVFTRGSPAARRIELDRASPNGSYMAFADAEHLLFADDLATVRLYHAPSGALVRTIGEGEGHLSAIGIGPEGRTIAVCRRGPPHDLVLYDLTSGRELARRTVPSMALTLTISADGRHVLAFLTGTNDLHVWAVTDGMMRASCPFPGGAFTRTLARLADGRLAAATWSDGRGRHPEISIAIWDPRTDRWATSRVIPPCPVQSLQFRPDGRALLVGGVDSTIHLMELDRPAPETGCPVGAGHEVWAVAVSPDSRVIVTGGDDHTVRLWDVRTRARLAVQSDHESLVTTAAFSPDGKWFATGSFDGTLVIRDPGTAAPRLVLSHGSKVRALVVSPDGRVIAAAGATGVVSVWEVGTGRLMHRLQGSARVIHALLFTDGGRALVAAPGETDLVWWDVETGQPIRTVSLRIRPSCLALSPDGRTVAVGFETGQIVFLDAATGREGFQVCGSPARLNGVAFSPDGRTIAATSGDGSVQLWQPGTGAWLFTLSRDGPQVNGIAFAPDGSFLAAARHDGRLLLWPTRDGTTPDR
jgi:serine/threonine protein kinase/WD40 repeat protein